MDFNEKYLDGYKKALLDLEDIDDILTCIPDSNHPRYDEFMRELVKFIDNEISVNREMQSDAKEDDLTYLNSECNKLNRIRGILLLKTKSNENSENAKKKNMIFLKTDADNLAVEKDIKQFPKEQLGNLTDLFKKVEEYSIDKHNDAAFKKFSGMKGGRSVFEAKTSSGARLYFTMLDIDTVLIVMASYKVEMNPKTARETLFKRISDNIGQINEIKSKIENEDEKAKLIEENMPIKDRIMESLDAKTR